MSNYFGFDTESWGDYFDILEEDEVILDDEENEEEDTDDDDDIEL